MAATTVQSQDVATLFTTAIKDIQSKLADTPKGTIGAVDIEVSFKSLQVEEKGFRFLWSKENTNQSALEIKLATRIYTDSLKQ